MKKHHYPSRIRGKGILLALLLFSFFLCLLQLASAQIPSLPYVPPDPAAIRAHQEQLRQHQDAQERPQVTVEGAVVKIRIPNLTLRPVIPILTLAAAARRYPQIHRFRLTWNCYGGLFISHSSALYDRTHHTVLLSVTGNDGKTENPLWHRSLFTHVTDRAIAEDARQHRGILLSPYHFFEASPLAFFNDLAFYGCPIRTFQEPAKTYHPHDPKVIMRRVV